MRKFKYRFAFLATVGRDRTFRFIIPLADQFQREPRAAIEADSKYAGLEWFREDTNRNRFVVGHYVLLLSSRSHDFARAELLHLVEHRR